MATPSFAAGAYASIQGMGAGNLLRKPQAASGSESGSADFAAMIGKALDATADAGRRSDAQAASVAQGRADVVDVVTAV
ncbi:MAG: flagellar hook-basal body complex protein FliE, partial [Bosea sp. (in: a-proteobacteria)]|nr:flagellar hook-basal body complex protein FliE [Bosea sp. (in: a-proteobacteria)]